MRSSVGVKILGAFNMLYGAYGLWWIWTQGLAKLSDYINQMLWFTVLLTLLSTAAMPAFFGSGLGLIMTRNWARILTLGLGVIAILFAIVSFVQWIPDLQSGSVNFDGARPLLFVLMFLIPAGWGVIVLWFLNRPSVKAQFQPK